MLIKLGFSPIFSIHSQTRDLVNNLLLENVAGFGAILKFPVGQSRLAELRRQERLWRFLRVLTIETHVIVPSHPYISWVHKLKFQYQLSYKPPKTPPQKNFRAPREGKKLVLIGKPYKLGFLARTQFFSHR